MTVKDARPRERSSKPTWQQEIARERIRILFGCAGKEFALRPDRSHRYVGLARKIATRYNIGIPKELKRRTCKNCYRYLVPGKNCVVRSNSGTQAMEVRCLECGKVGRYPYSKEKG